MISKAHARIVAKSREKSSLFISCLYNRSTTTTDNNSNNNDYGNVKKNKKKNYKHCHKCLESYPVQSFRGLCLREHVEEEFSKLKAWLAVYLFGHT